MALHLNLLHEELYEQRQRQRDPLKIGTLVLCFLGGLMFVYYMWNGYQTLEIKGRLSAVERDWKKVEPKVTSAQKRAAELSATISTTRVLDNMIENRFYWAPFLQKLSRCVALNAQLTNVDGTVAEETKVVSVSIEGVAAGREPRAAAEELRQLLAEQLTQGYAEVKVEFKTLEDLDTVANIGGSAMGMSRYVLGVSFNPFPNATPKPAAAPARVRAPKQ